MTSPDASITFESPLGYITVEAIGEKITHLRMSNSKGDEFGNSPVLREAKKQLKAYLAGKLTKFELPLDLRGTDFQKAVWKQIAKTGFGKTITYGEIAQRIGNPSAMRAVGGAVGSNPVALIVGCHRVLGSNGRITGYSGGDGIPTKRWLLDHEDIITVD